MQNGVDMNTKLIISLAMVILVAGSSLSLADSSSSNTDTSVHTLGNFSFSVAANNSLQNLTYSRDGNSYMFASMLSVQGQNISGAVSTSGVSGSRIFSTANATLESAGNSNLLTVMTTGTGKEGMQINMNGTVSKISSSSNIELKSFGMFSFMDNTWAVYRVNNSMFEGYFLTDGSVSVSGSRLAVSPSPTMLKFGSFNNGVLISAFVDHQGLNEILHRVLKRNDHRFTYNKTTGLVNGTYVGFNFNNTTGTVSNFTANALGNLRIFNEISATGNGTLGSSRYLPVFRDGNFSILGSLFLYANSSYVFVMHNNPTLNTGALLNNGTMKFALAAGFNVTELHLFAGAETTLNASTASSNNGIFMNETLNLNENVQASSNAYLIHGHGLRGFLYVGGANYSSYNSTTHVIEVRANSSSVAHITFVAPPGLQKISSSAIAPLEYAIEHGKIAAELSIEDMGKGAVNFSTFFNNSLSINVTSAGSGKVSLIVSSTQHLGNNIAIFVNSSFLSSTGKIYVYFDGKLATQLTGAGSALNITSNVKAYYAAVPENGGYLVIVHIPHFSTHNVTISSTPEGPVSNLPGGMTYLDLGIIGAVVVVIVAGTAIVYTRRKK